MSWTTVRPTAQTAQGRPSLSIYPNLGGRVNAAADLHWFHDYDAVTMQVDMDAVCIGLMPADDPDADDTFALSRSDGGTGADVELTTALKYLGIDTDTLDETQHVPLEWDGERAVADVSHLQPDVEVDGGTGDDSDGDDSDGLTDAEIAAAAEQTATLAAFADCLGMSVGLARNVARSHDVYDGLLDAVGYGRGTISGGSA